MLTIDLGMPRFFFKGQTEPYENQRHSCPSFLILSRALHNYRVLMKPPLKTLTVYSALPLTINERLPAPAPDSAIVGRQQRHLG